MTPEIKTVKLSDIIFREDLYPRINTNHEVVQKYAEDLDVLPPIEINQANELIDGWHRWTAHKKAQVETISCTVIETKSDSELLELAIDRNAKHGLQLSQEDKKDMARKIYHTTPERDRQEKKKYLAKILSVSPRTIQNWLSRIDKDAKESRDKKIFDLWLSCHSRDDIAEITCCSTGEVSTITSKTANLQNLTKPQQAAAEHATDFDPPIYNIWKQQSKSKGSNHYGNSEITWLDNLLYLYTNPFDIVIDPFAGGGSTIDLCKKRLRRYFISDRLPIPEREKEIRQHDIVDGIPQIPRWKDVKLVYLDPPYWKQAEGQYSNDAQDLANMSLDKFNETLSGIIKAFAKKLKNGTPAYIALIIQPTQWKAPERQFTDHVGDMLRMVNLPVNMRYSVPYESQQYTAQMVEWAKENKQTLVLTREIIVWEVI